MEFDLSLPEVEKETTNSSLMFTFVPWLSLIINAMPVTHCKHGYGHAAHMGSVHMAVK